MREGIDHFAVEFDMTSLGQTLEKMTGKIQDDGTFNLIRGEGVLQSS